MLMKTFILGEEQPRLTKQCNGVEPFVPFEVPVQGLVGTGFAAHAVLFADSFLHGRVAFLVLPI